MNYATYIRVSTQKQGRSGLGLDAQRKMCADFIATHGGTMSQEFCDVESGTHRNRKGLQDAIAFCKKNSMPLVIAKLDRLARDVEFCFKVVNTGIEIHFCDMPQMNTLLLGVFASVAQYERELTSDRTKKALAVKKRKGAKLGAANEKYQETHNSKTKEEIDEMNEKRGALKTQHYLESRDVKAFEKALRSVFGEELTSGSPKDWWWTRINLKHENKERVLMLMSDYKELDPEGTLFKSWDFDDNAKATRKLYSFMQAYKKAVMKS